MALGTAILFLTGEGAETGSNLIPSNVTEAITSSGQDILASVGSVMGVVAPVALSIMGLVMAITIGIKLFKKLTKSGANG